MGQERGLRASSSILERRRRCAYRSSTVSLVLMFALIYVQVIAFFEAHLKSVTVYLGLIDV